MEIRNLVSILNNVRLAVIAMIASVLVRLVREPSAALIMAAAKKLSLLKNVHFKVANPLVNAVNLVSRVVVNVV